MSCAGTTWVSTPHLDRLARSGVRFTRAYCSDPVCVPSRFSMFTGRMPSAIGMRGNGGQSLHDFSDADDRTGLGHCLRWAGYDTWYGGKVHWPIGLTPGRLGFTTFSSDERESLAIDAAALIHRGKGRRWGMVVSLINPHDICYQAIRAFASEPHLLVSAQLELANLDQALRPPPGIDQETFLRDLLPPLPENFEVQDDEPEMISEVINRRWFRAAARERWSGGDWRLHRWAYARLMEQVDRQIGVVLDAITASGQEQETLVIMTSDHGDHAGAHRLEHKTFFYDQAARVPWIMSLPGRIPAGRIEEHCLVATGLDLLPTCCSYAGVEVPAPCRGFSLQAAAEGRSGAEVRDAVYGENLISRMLVTARHKYVRYDRGRNAEQLYDLVTDPGETRNHITDGACSAALAGLSARLDVEQALHAGLALGPLGEEQAGE